MVTRAYKIYGVDGHRQRESFCPSAHYDFSDNGKVRILDELNADKTGTHDYTVLRITRDTAEQVEDELEGQLSDGIFENCNVGEVHEVIDLRELDQIKNLADEVKEKADLEEER
jgi:hypothetical protein